MKKVNTNIDVNWKSANKKAFKSGGEREEKREEGKEKRNKKSCGHPVEQIQNEKNNNSIDAVLLFAV